MNQQVVASVFNEFLERQLAPLGFVPRTSSLAERVLSGFRQMISWHFSKLGTASTFVLDVRLSYAHHVDDAISHAAASDGHKPACSGYVRVLHMFDSLTEGDIKNGLNGVRRQLVNLLNSTQSADQIYTTVNDDLSTGPSLLGHNQLGFSFNYAYCMEIAGMKREAARMFADLSGSRLSNRSSFAICLREAARERAIALKSYLPDDALKQLCKSTSPNAASIPVAATAISETELAKRAIPQHTSPDMVLPGNFVEAITRAYSPAAIFWLNIDAERLVSELENQHPAYMRAVEMAWQGVGCGSFHEDLVNSIRTRQFDEYSARWLLSLPQDLVSNDDDSAVYELLHDHLKRTGNSAHLRYLELDGVKAIGYIRDRMDLMLGGPT
ncbi:hypothetical protein [Paraburkholderia sp. Cpub6]|uniref:hypothetical protein n=1 Tax=Paraburkholderia sp. Cpub6 TaxID=2723094 RepID=UPI0016157907|nr:hypothetical protein [Paraburkholderia sp. Cpub6]MBB5460237.1 hypothetical protein [Paraburkholderia sp. Cpub6]